ncbi:MAG TPA: anthranilate phosphoribosyltransferase [Pyrinomonadaceae bacterium]|nr:anthranilate phosphoribosyltransferase [Pyrinomonadaceae bacterium]
MAATRSDWLKYAPQTATSPRGDTPLFPYLAKLMRREHLSQEEASEFFRALTDPAAGSNQIAAALTALTIKGETPDELAGMASVMRSLAVKVKAPRTAIDISGTGASRTRTFSVSTAAALVAAGAGLVVAKQSNRGAVTKSGSADVLGELGVKLAQDAQFAQTLLPGAGIAFFSAPSFHPALRRIADVRAKLGIRTCLNVLGLLANPAGVRYHLIGVWHRALIEPVSRALALLGAENAWVVHGSDGLDELTLSGKTFVGAVKDGEARPYVISPADFGIKPAKIDGLAAKSVKENASFIRDVLAGKGRDEARSLVVLNAAAAIFIGGFANDPVHAARLAERSIDSGMAQNKLERLVQVSAKR